MGGVPEAMGSLCPHIAPDGRAAGGQGSSLGVRSFPEAAPEGVESWRQGFLFPSPKLKGSQGEWGQR